MYKMEAFKNQRFKLEVHEQDKKCEAIRFMLANRLIDQCSSGIRKTKITTRALFSTTKMDWALSKCFSCIIVATMCKGKTCILTTNSVAWFASWTYRSTPRLLSYLALTFFIENVQFSISFTRKLALGAVKKSLSITVKTNSKNDLNSQLKS